MASSRVAPIVALLLVAGLALLGSSAAQSSGGSCLKETAPCRLLNDTCCASTMCTMSLRCTSVKGPEKCRPSCLKRVTVDLKARQIGPGLIGYEAGKKKAPAVVVLQEWWGVNNPIKETAYYIGQQGYRVLVPDLYRGVVADNASHAQMLQARLNWTQAVIDMNHAVAYLKATGSPRVAVTGFCQGGALALCAAQHSGVVAAAPFYGAPNRAIAPCQVETIKVPVLYQWGALDSAGNLVNFNNASATMKNAGVKVQTYVYPNATHAFMNLMTPVARDWALASGRRALESEVVLAFARLTDFLAKYLLKKK